MTVAEVAEELGVSVAEARGAHRRLMAAEDRIMAAWRADEEKRTKRKLTTVRRRRRPPEWCLPPWERKNGAQNIAFCEAKRAGRDQSSVKAWWIWTDGKPVVKSDTLDGAKALAGIRAMLYDTYVWAVEDWEEEKRRNPQIEEVLKAYS